MTRPSAAADPRETRLGLLYAAAAYGWWGVVPLYFALLKHVPTLAVVSHRIVWSTLFLAMILLLQRRTGEVLAAVRNRRTLALLALGSLFIGINWFVYIYAVATSRVIEGSLGYYMNPLVSVLLGLVVLRERLRPWQWASVALAAAGVAIPVVTTSASGFPWIAVTLAVSFAFYGLIRKFVKVGPMVGLLVETAVLLPLAAAIIGWGPGVGPSASLGTYALLALAGVVTALPLLWFANAAQRLRLTTVGFMQYIGPSLQLVLAVTVLGEGVDAARMACFALIWLALAIYTIDALRTHRLAAAAPPAVAMAE